jgi:hypothetical protein
MILLMVPWGRFPEGTVLERGEVLEYRLIAEKKAIRVVPRRDPVERAVIRPKERRNEYV